MADHTVTIESGAEGSAIRFPPVFNAAATFIDRHLDEGRAAKVVIRTTAGEEVTYGALAEAVNRAGNALVGLGLGPGERLLMMVKDCPEFFYLFWGAIKAGVVPVPVNTMLRAPDYRYMIEDSGAAIVAYSPEFAAEVGPALEAADSGARGLLVDGETLGSLIAAASPELAPASAAPTDDCFWLYSSGSTGRPKGAVHSHRDMAVASQRYAVEALGVGEDDVHYSAAKLFFAYGLGNAMTFPLWVGGTAILDAARPTPQGTFEIIEKFKPTLFYGVPTLYVAQLQALEEAKPDLSSLRHCVSAGEALPADVFRRWKQETGLVILDGIGSTEALHVFISNTPGDQRPGTTGLEVPGYEARIVDEAANGVARGESGTLLIRGDSTAKYYWNKEAKTAETMLGDGWLNTGDTYRQDADGYYVFEGRADDMMKVGGIWTSPIEIEARLIEHPKVLEAAVVGRADDSELVKPEAWIILNDPKDAGEAVEKELLQYCKTGLAPYKYPRWFRFVEELPKTATGKIQRFKLRAGEV